MPNRLAQERSLYLRQHAENPVDWHPWGPEAFALAKDLNRPIFLSIGYSSCHWCHVMAAESFESPQVGEFLNQHFVSIKVDRDELPDVDEVYMTATQVANGHGGWPMTLFLDHQGRPFFAGTYFPPEPRGGMPSFFTLINGIHEAWVSKQPDIQRTCEDFTQAVKVALGRTVPAEEGLHLGLIDRSLDTFHESYDNENGGFGTSPKFPPHSAIRFLLRYQSVRGTLSAPGPDVTYFLSEAKRIAEGTLDALCRGGIHDHVFGGFHRYSTDAEWHLPHFEKMLSDNALMLRNLAEAGRGDQLAARGIVEWVQSEMTLPNGMFASTQDAVTSRGEGSLVVWTESELQDALGPDYDQVAKAFGIRSEGNFREEATGRQTGGNILHLQPGATLPEGWRAKLQDARRDAERPVVDRKAIMSSNGLMIGALARAGEAEMASRAAEAWCNLLDSAPHAWDEGPVGFAYLDDLACLADGLLDLEEHAAANRLADRMIDEFYDPAAGAFTSSGKRHQELIGRSRPFMDSAMPSGNGVAMRVLRRLGRHDLQASMLASGIGWAERVPMAAETILEEALEALVEGIEPAAPHLEGRTIASLSETELTPEPDGWAYTEVHLQVPEGRHINSAQPAADWLIPLSVGIEGAFGEAGFPEQDDDTLTGLVVVPVRLRPRGEEPSFTIVVTWQECSDTYCLSPTTVALEGKFRSVPGMVR